ncbi:MAG: ATP-binding cassette domain-containing protein [Tannerella sp.]|jgi:molybdate transport system ATP-binding protein|nr:ATP-binding cassette domain-containing protein [Tannerella sp.]
MINVRNAIPRNPDFRFREPVSLTIGRNEHIAIVGPNGGGKSVLAQMLTGNYPLKEGWIEYDFYPSPVYKNIKFIAFKDSYGPADVSYYLQQRWNSQDRNESPLVRDVLERSIKESSEDLSCEVFKRRNMSDTALRVPVDTLGNPLFKLLGIDGMFDKQMVMLSSGEMRKFQLTKALLARPHILIIDNPFIGLDVTTRRLLHDILSRLVEMGDVGILLILAKTDEIPDFITHVVLVEDMLCKGKIVRSDFCATVPETPFTGDLYPPETHFVPDFFISGNIRKKEDNDMVIEMRDVSIRYGKRTILSALNWSVRYGERWAVLGKNGSGKSTLLSLVCADNPQSYACDISLFGFRRGSGESIWDIKKHIGYVSPEMHRSYSENIPAIAIVASGLYDSVGLYIRPKPEQLTVCEWWMNIFGIRGLRSRSFLQLSDGEQRLVLLARAFVKDPELLILDEPFHGLDTCNRLRVRAIIESFCRRPCKTLIMVTHYEEELPESITHRLVLEKK